MPYKVTVDREKCIACGAAAALCPEVFMMGEDIYKLRVSDKYSKYYDEQVSIGEIPDELYNCAKEAADSCPVNAIKIEKT
ncbi:MAG: ferredoxin [Candidatus Nezhaarchaeota archaeon]|nr:ferredoxin [Candidatus Nezhaarchaeota archaeon]MCX8141712.1 ferredoxin [Candidatus Nezhaarchaeota archaeon]MDW8049979.1 ferredoxin [Nitrososphaerota archaeon]